MTTSKTHNAALISGLTSTIASLSQLLAALGEPTAVQPALHTLATRRVKPRKIHAPKNGYTRKATESTGRIPAALMKKINRMERKRAKPPLDENDKAAIKTLLSTGNISVKTIAQLYHISTAYVYALNHSFGLRVHRGSPALMQGIKKMKAAKAQAAQPVETSQVTTTPAEPTPRLIPQEV